MVARYGPAALAASAQQLSNASAESWLGLLREYWSAGAPDDAINAFEQFLPRAFLQPCAELLALRSAKADLPFGNSRCPLCNSKAAPGHSSPGRRWREKILVMFVLPSRVGISKNYLRHLRRRNRNKAARLCRGTVPDIRVEACDTCKYYLRTIDLTKDGNAVALVDDPAAIPLSLSARHRILSRAAEPLGIHQYRPLTPDIHPAPNAMRSLISSGRRVFVPVPYQAAFSFFIPSTSTW